MSAITPDHPSGAALLDVARRALLDEIAPALAGRPRYVVLMVANAVGIAMRELDGAEAAKDAWDRALATIPAADGDPLEALVLAIRSGGKDADPALHAALTATTAIAAGIWKPSAPEKPAQETGGAKTEAKATAA